MAVLAVLVMLVPATGFVLFGSRPTLAAGYMVTITGNVFQNPVGTSGSTLNIQLGDSVEWLNQSPNSQDIDILSGPALNVSPENSPRPILEHDLHRGRQIPLLLRVPSRDVSRYSCGRLDHHQPG